MQDDIDPAQNDEKQLDGVETAEERAGQTAESQEAEEQEKLSIEVKIENRSACERHITVTIPHDEVERYFDKTFTELMPTAAVPGFRAGRAPRKLVEHRFRKDVAEQVKNSLLMDSLGQVNADEKLTPISEPDFDPAAVVVPDEGPMTFEFDLEVRPEFDLPKWKGLAIQRPVREFTKEDIDKQLQDILAQHGRLVPFEGAAEPGDYISVNLTFKHGDEVVSSAGEEVLRIRPVLSFRDGKIEKFDELMRGVRAGETREGKATLSEDAPNESLRGKDVTAVFEVLEVKKLELPELTPEFLDELGGFANEGDLRDAIQESLERRLVYQQQRAARQQVTAALTVAADWELPPAMLRRQSGRELERSVLELRRSGFDENEIRAHENELRQNSQAATARALKEHFILERIAEEEKVTDEPEDYDVEINLIARQSGESARRVRARLEKQGLMDALRNQIIERKVVELILASATFKDVPYHPEKVEAEAVDQAAGGGEESEIPAATHADEAKPLRQPEDHT